MKHEPCNVDFVDFAERPDGYDGPMPCYKLWYWCPKCGALKIDNHIISVGEEKKLKSVLKELNRHDRRYLGVGD